MTNVKRLKGKYPKGKMQKMAEGMHKAMMKKMGSDDIARQTKRKK